MFFTQLLPLLDGKTMTFVVTEKDGIITAMVSFKGTDKSIPDLPPVIIKGTRETLDAEFIAALSRPVAKLDELLSMEAFEAAVDNAKKSEEKKGEVKKTAAATKSKSKAALKEEEEAPKEEKIEVAKEKSQAELMVEEAEKELALENYFVAIQLFLKAEKLEPKNQVIKEKLYNARLAKQKFEAGISENPNPIPEATTPVVEKTQTSAIEQAKGTGFEQPVQAPGFSEPVPEISQPEVPQQPVEEPKDENIIPQSINQQFSF
jgi:hypothetical protein